MIFFFQKLPKPLLFVFTLGVMAFAYWGIAEKNEPPPSYPSNDVQFLNPDKDGEHKNPEEGVKDIHGNPHKNDMPTIADEDKTVKPEKE